ncbi:hypothetical protein BH10BAC3_BH10BAC3_39630 [soil metagenome]
MENFTKESIERAIEKIDRNPELRNGRESTNYDFVFGGKRFPPILVLSEANQILGGKSLTLEDFGNKAPVAFKIFNELGFEVTSKGESFYPELEKFLQQSRTSNMKYKHYKKTFQQFDVSVSFGQTNAANVPWIAFLDYDQTVQQGIYPVYLFYKKDDILILAYGVSAKNKPIKDWDVSPKETISFFFKEGNLSKPKYGTSYVFRIYKVSEGLNPDEIDNDLNAILEEFRNQFKNERQPTSPMPLPTQQPPEKFNYHQCFQAFSQSGLQITKTLLLRFIASLITKPFVILTGLSGSGKTKIAQAFAKWICESEDQYCLTPVGADWTNREPLLGFPNALKSSDYVKPDNRVLDLIIEASKNSHKPYFLILDEMNLSHVERYFADFLSVMESNSNLFLHSGNQQWNGVPSEITLPQNLFIVGTVNIDETTYMFSPKVLDRANVIEFRVTEREMENYLNNFNQLNLDLLSAAGVGMSNDFIKMANDKLSTARNPIEIKKSLIDFFKELKKTGAEFGYRSASEIMRFAGVIERIEPAWTNGEILDAAIMQKLLPKVHGSRRKLEPILKALGSLCLQEGQKVDDFISSKNTVDFYDDSKIKYPISLEKILRMYDGLLNNGFTSYAEA